jgi:hypothetical protein
MTNIVIMFQTNTVFVVGELLSFYTRRLDTRLVLTGEPLAITENIPNYNQEDGQWYAWTLSDACCSFEYVTAIKSLAKINNLLGIVFEAVQVNGSLINRELGCATLGTQNYYQSYALTNEDKSDQEIVFAKISELLNLRLEVEILNSRLSAAQTLNGSYQ